MNKLFRVGIVVSILLIGTVLATAGPDDAKKLAALDAPADAWVGEDAIPVDLVICLDNSGSMKDLLEQVRLRLWDITNELGALEPAPALRVGLVTFGDRTASRTGFVRTQFDLTSDLDFVYSRLMELENTSGGHEFVGRALHVAVESMGWSDDADALKMIVVAGNEPADQGSESYDFRNVAAEARARNIVVNALYAGKPELGITERWQELAESGEGSFLALESPGAMRSIVGKTPYDGDLAALNAELNASYLPIGAEGEKRLTVQTEQDAHAARLGVLNDRIETKVGRFYENGGWDLVDAARRPGFDRAAWDDAELPASVRGLDQEALLDLLGAKAAERDAVKARIRELVEQRDAFLRGDGKEGAPAPKPDALRSIIAGQAEAKGFRRAGS